LTQKQRILLASGQEKFENHAYCIKACRTSRLKFPYRIQLSLLGWGGACPGGKRVIEEMATIGCRGSESPYSSDVQGTVDHFRQEPLGKAWRATGMWYYLQIDTVVWIREERAESERRDKLHWDWQRDKVQKKSKKEGTTQENDHRDLDFAATGSKNLRWHHYRHINRVDHHTSGTESEGKLKDLAIRA